MKKLQQTDKELSINARRLCNLRFAVGIIPGAETASDLKEMMKSLNDQFEKHDPQ